MSRKIEIDINGDRESAPKVLGQLKDLFSSHEKVMLFSCRKEKSDLLPVIDSGNVTVSSYSNVPETLTNTPRGQCNTLFVIENTTGTDFTDFVNNAMNPTNSVILLNVNDEFKNDNNCRKIISIKIEADCNDPAEAINGLQSFACFESDAFKTKNVSIKVKNKE